MQTVDYPPYKDDRPPKGVTIGRRIYDLERLPTSFSLPMIKSARED
jgi:hypothetical protein